MAGTSKELNELLLLNYFYFKSNGSFPVIGESAFIFIQSYLITSKTHTLEIIFADVQNILMSRKMYVKVMMSELFIYLLCHSGKLHRV
jgi:hypothetical protein